MVRNEVLDTIISSVIDRQLGKAINQLDNYLYTFVQPQAAEQLEQIKNNYLLLTDYWQNGYEDPQREQVIEAIRSLLSWLDANHLNALHASTQIIIAPGYEFKIVKQLITNFHQPQSTLLLLVSAFTKGQWRIIYEHALANGYRFLSYGDSSLLKV